MKSHEDDPYALNSLAEMRARLVFVVCLAAIVAGVILTVSGTLTRDLRLLAGGVGALVVSGVAREWLHRRGRFFREDSACPAPGGAEPRADPVQVEALRALLQACERMEQRRGSPDFDPWELLAVRHDIRVMVEKDPALEQVFQH